MLRTIYYKLSDSIAKSEEFAALAKLAQGNNKELKKWQADPTGSLPQKLSGEVSQAIFEDMLIITDEDMTAEDFGGITVGGAEGTYPCPIVGYQPGGSTCYLPYKYIVEDISGIDMDYLEMVYRRFHGLPLDILETDRLKLREITLDDIDRLYEIYAEPSITEYMEGLYENKDKEIEFTRSYIENMYTFYGYGLWGVCTKDGKLIGRAGLGNREVDGEIYLELGYVIEKEHQRKGYATEICTAIMEYAKNVLEADSLICLIESENTASIRTAQKLGFKYERSVCVGDRELELYKIEM
ncbi:MAG: GNAT family N-acetyltransferase [Lachnospiraceae bacterium]|nr:GNAT family N-acetyltransferase [Lachnospiraceae bacterium]